jgi:hypothetical protein
MDYYVQSLIVSPNYLGIMCPNSDVHLIVDYREKNRIVILKDIPSMFSGEVTIFCLILGKMVGKISSNRGNPLIHLDVRFLSGDYPIGNILSAVNMEKKPLEVVLSNEKNYDDDDLIDCIGTIWNGDHSFIWDMVIMKKEKVTFNFIYTMLSSDVGTKVTQYFVIYLDTHQKTKLISLNQSIAKLFFDEESFREQINKDTSQISYLILPN